eukprot:3720407-Pleurochrysis_carterae.AAC.4
MQNALKMLWRRVPLARLTLSVSIRGSVPSAWVELEAMHTRTYCGACGEATAALRCDPAAAHASRRDSLRQLPVEQLAAELAGNTDRVGLDASVTENSGSGSSFVDGIVSASSRLLDNCAERTGQEAALSGS